MYAYPKKGPGTPLLDIGFDQFKYTLGYALMGLGSKPTTPKTLTHSEPVNQIHVSILEGSMDLASMVTITQTRPSLVVSVVSPIVALLVKSPDISNP